MPVIALNLYLDSKKNNRLLNRVFSGSREYVPEHILLKIKLININDISL